MRYPTKINAGADRVNSKLTGAISRNTVPSMNPAPNAMKYRNDRLAQSCEVTIRPPMMLASAAANAKRMECANSRPLSGMTDCQDIAVLHHILLAFQSQ